MGILIVMIGRTDICFSITSLSKFGVCPRQGHLDLLLHVYGYLKRFPSKRIAIDSNDIDLNQIPNIEQQKTDFLQEYVGICEEIDEKFPIPNIDELQIIFLVDSDHAHDGKTQRAITGIICCVGLTPIICYSKIQGAVSTSTHSTEFVVL